jgi:hypothetical protein
MPYPDSGAPITPSVGVTTALPSLRSFLQFLLGVVVVGILVNLASDYL